MLTQIKRILAEALTKTSAPLHLVQLEGGDFLPSRDDKEARRDKEPNLRKSFQEISHLKD